MQLHKRAIKLFIIVIALMGIVISTGYSSRRPAHCFQCQFARAIREGIRHDGRRLFPMMPYMNFRQMSDEDLAR